ncbi:MAG: OBAP family protein [Deltaproteobacteria bacterium]|nr:OBAP family protein [Deltaproteobacteria bacterium]
MLRRTLTLAPSLLALACLPFLLAAGEAAAAEKKAKSEKEHYGVAAPLKALGVYLDAFHFHSGNMDAQMEIHHWCGPVNDDLIQCALFDGKGKDAHLVGIEYVVSAKLFATFPDEERKLWHSHSYEVKSGQLVSPGMAEKAEKALMEKLISTYGKTWHTWQSEKDKVPVGVPELMMAFTADGQAKPALITERDRKVGVSTEAKKKARTSIAAPQLLPGADSWQKGEVVRFQLVK